MLLHVQHNIQISRRPAELLPPRPQPEKRIRVPSSTPAGTFASTIRCRRIRPSPLHFAHGSVITVPVALASRTSPRNAEKSLLISHLPAPSARPATGRAFARRRARAAAILARLVPPHLHPLLRAKYRFFKFQRQIFAKIRSTLRPAAAPSAAATKNSPKPKNSPKMSPKS